MTRADAERKIRALAALINHPETGNGERDAATNAVNRLMSRHGITPEEVGFYIEITDDEWDAAIPFFDQGWDGTNWKPSELAVIGDCMFATEHYLGKRTLAQAEYRQHLYRRHILDRARGRWRDGYYPNPFTLDPKPRPDAPGAQR